jgi:hypothetical protein
MSTLKVSTFAAHALLLGRVTTLARRETRTTDGGITVLTFDVVH